MEMYKKLAKTQKKNENKKHCTNLVQNVLEYVCTCVMMNHDKITF